MLAVCGTSHGSTSARRVRRNAHSGRRTRLLTQPQLTFAAGLDFDEDGPGTLLDEALYGHLRLKVESHGDRPVFVGIARTADVERYLGETAHSVVTDVSLDPFEADYRRHGGARPPADPADQHFWVASAHGSSPQTVTWKVRNGGGSIVVMNADGSRGVDAGVSAGASLPILTPVAWGLTGACCWRSSPPPWSRSVSAARAPQWPPDRCDYGS
jgi:hypothetical protein